jgi:uncharacterized protein YjbI with pentapeptide repeats
MNISKIIEDHELWLKTDGEEGKRARFSYVDLSRFDFSGRNLREAYFEYVNLCGAKFIESNLINAEIRNCTLNSVNMSGADICSAFFYNCTIIDGTLNNCKAEHLIFEKSTLSCSCLYKFNANNSNFCQSFLKHLDVQDSTFEKTKFNHCNVNFSNFQRSIFQKTFFDKSYFNNCSFRCSVLKESISFDSSFPNCLLEDACILNVKHNNASFVIHSVCPSDGAFIAWKTIMFGKDIHLIKLLIPEDAERSSSTTRKCRASKAVVLDIENLSKNTHVDEIVNTRYVATLYKVGEEVIPDSWDNNRWNECSHGIHFFITREEAINYISNY